MLIIKHKELNGGILRLILDRTRYIVELISNKQYDVLIDTEELEDALLTYKEF